MSLLSIITGIEARTMLKAGNLCSILAQLCVNDFCKAANFCDTNNNIQSPISGPVHHFMRCGTASEKFGLPADNIHLIHIYINGQLIALFIIFFNISHIVIHI